MTTALSSLRGKLQTAIGDDKQVYAAKYTDAINNAIREIYPNLHERLEDTSLTTTNSDYEYDLPSDFEDGTLSQVFVQISGDEDDFSDARWHKVYGWEIIDDGTDKYLQLPRLYGAGKTIRLIGYCPLETLTADTGTISLDGEKVNLLIAYAAYLLYEMVESVPASGDVSRYERASSKWLSKYYRLLPSLKMTTPRMSMNLPNY